MVESPKAWARHDPTGRCTATLDPSKPVIGEYVLDYFGMQVPRWGTEGRETKTIELYRELCDRCDVLLHRARGNYILESLNAAIRTRKSAN